MPAGTYDVKLTNGLLDLGTGLLPPLPIDSGTAFVVPIGTTPVSQPIGLTLLSSPINVSGLTGTLNLTVTGAGVTIDPATGNATGVASFYGSVNLSGIISGLPLSGSCTFGSSATPVTVAFDTAKGSPWDPATGAFSMKDNTFALPYSCTPLIATFVSTFLGNTGPGSNIAILNGIAIRLPDPVTPVTSSTTTTATSTPQPGSTSTGGNPTETPLTAPVATKSCVVPKLVGMTLKQAKRAITKAGCNVGKAKKASSKKRKKGRIVKQPYKAGTKLPAGTKIPLTISKGPKKARKHTSR
jgi:hypothetical protein